MRSALSIVLLVAGWTAAESGPLKAQDAAAKVAEPESTTQPGKQTPPAAEPARKPQPSLVLVPQARVSFRYNHFDRALSVTGIGDASPFLDPTLGPFVSRQPLQTRKFDVDSYTLSFEKTFWDSRFSVETRIPFNSGLSSHLDLS